MTAWKLFRLGLMGIGVGGAMVGLGVPLAVAQWTNRTDQLSSFRVVRFGRAALAVLQVTVDYKWTFWRMEESDPEYWPLRSQVHQRSAARLCAVCCSNGGVFIKVGQHLGAMDYLLPSEYVKAFKVLHSTAPEMPFSQLSAVIQEDLGQSVEELFDSVEGRPLGAASLAQCHRARLRDGREVAVKVQFPDVRRNAETDLKSMEFLVKCVSRVFPNVRFEWLVSEVKRNLPKELDFYYEGENIEQFASKFSHLKFVKVPKVYWDLTTERVLTMEFMEGGQVDDRDFMKRHHIATHEVSRKIAKLYSEMIFFQGYVHCDPHPGNVLVRKGSRGQVEVVLLDHGLYTHLSDDFRLTYCKLWMAILRKDLENVKIHAQALNGGELYPLLACIIAGRSWDSIVTGVDKTVMNTTETHRLQRNAKMYFGEITQILNSVPRELLLILKTNDLIRCIEHSLGTPHNQWAFLEMSSNCIRAVGRHEVQCTKRPLTKLYCMLRTQFLLLGVWVYRMWLDCAGSIQLVLINSK